MHGTMTVAEVAALLESLVPQRLAAPWDNVGLLLGRGQHKVEKILLALDLTEETCRQACEGKTDLIITHHPVIFQPLKQMTGETWRQELLLRLAEKQIAVYSLHTNLDCAAHGVNMALAKKLKIRDVFELDEESGLGRIGYLEEPQPDVRSFALIVKKTLRASYVAYGDAGRPVRRVAVCGGAGADLVPQALAKGADTLVTGDVTYHKAQEAVYRGLNIIDAGHQTSEWPVLEELADRLSLRFTEKNWPITVTVAKEELLLKGV